MIDEDGQMVEKKKIKQVSSSSKPKVESQDFLARLLKSAAKASAALEWAKAAGLYTQALSIIRESPSPDVMTEFDILEKRSNCYKHLGDVNADIQDRESMLELAQRTGNLAMQVRTLIGLQYAYGGQGNFEKSRVVAEEAVSLASQTGDQKLEGDSLNALVDVLNRQGLFVEMNQYADKAIKIFRELDDAAGEARTLWILSYANKY